MVPPAPGVPPSDGQVLSASIVMTTGTVAPGAMVTMLLPRKPMQPLCGTALATIATSPVTSSARYRPNSAKSSAESIDSGYVFVGPGIAISVTSFRFTARSSGLSSRRFASTSDSFPFLQPAPSNVYAASSNAGAALRGARITGQHSIRQCPRWVFIDAAPGRPHIRSQP